MVCSVKTVRVKQPWLTSSMGAVPKDSGEILLNGRPVEVNTVGEGTATWDYQDSSGVKCLSQADGGREHLCQRLPRAKPGTPWADRLGSGGGGSAEAFCPLHFPLDPRRKVGSLGVAQQQMVAIARALAANPKILILDEPTAALNEQETEYFLRMLEKIQKTGVTMLYISHRLREIKLIADRVTVIRDGRDVATIPTPSLEEEKAIKLMVGLETKSRYPNLGLPAKKELLRIENLSVGNILRGISFTLHEGETLGIAGLAGSGRTTLMKTVFGLLKPTSGRIFLRGREIRPNTVRQAIKLGFAYVMEDRLAEGLFINRSVMENISSINLERISKGRLINNELEKKIAWGLNPAVAH